MEFNYSFVPDINQEYSVERGYGFAMPKLRSKTEELRDSWPGDYFVPMVPSLLMDVPNGNYEVKLTIGAADRAGELTVKAGLGHLRLFEVKTAVGETKEKTFTVHVNDGQLKLAFAGSYPFVQHVEVTRSASIPTLFLAGDSTVTDQPSGHYPYTGWGQMIGLFLGSELAIANHACSGRSSKSFITETRLNRIAKKLRKDDILVVQFAHNDEKENEGGTEPFTTYQQYLKQYIELAREKNAHPILVTAMHRRFFEEDGSIRNTHGEYIEAARQLAIREGVPYIDLAALSKSYFEELGEQRSTRVFLWTEQGQYDHMPEETKDNTHFSEYGAIHIARLVAEGIMSSTIEPLKRYLISEAERNELMTSIEESFNK